MVARQFVKSGRLALRVTVIITILHVKVLTAIVSVIVTVVFCFGGSGSQYACANGIVVSLRRKQRTIDILMFIDDSYLFTSGKQHDRYDTIKTSRVRYLKRV